MTESSPAKSTSGNMVAASLKPSAAGDPRWGAQHREEKAAAILQTLRHFVTPDPARGDWLDLGCGSGGIAAWLADHVDTITGVDPESWERWRTFREKHPNLRFVQATAEESGLPDDSVDVVICNQVYEHVDDPQRLINEIRRVLRPGGYCYFAGPNLLFPIEPHVFWPFVHWLPREVASGFVKAFGAKNLVHYALATPGPLRPYKLRSASPFARSLGFFGAQTSCRLVPSSYLIDNDDGE